MLLENIYDEFNQAVETRSNGSVIKNTYNGDGLRVVKDTNGTKTNYLYEGMQVVLQTDVSNNETGRNVLGNNLISRTTGGKTYDYAYNRMGEITGLIDEAGSIATSYYYDAFGVQTERTGSVVNPYSYKSYQYDEESKLYYLNSRYYDPETARFLTEDTVRGEVGDPLSLNLYTYCLNNPVMRIDPDGHMSFDVGNGVMVQMPEDNHDTATKHKENAKSGYNKWNTDWKRTGIMKRYSIGQRVKELQKMLRDLGFYDGPIDGKFGGGTERAVLKFQDANNLKKDGIVGNQTWGCLQANFTTKHMSGNVPSDVKKQIKQQARKITAGQNKNGFQDVYGYKDTIKAVEMKELQKEIVRNNSIISKNYNDFSINGIIKKVSSFGAGFVNSLFKDLLIDPARDILSILGAYQLSPFPV